MKKSRPNRGITWIIFNTDFFVGWILTLFIFFNPIFIIGLILIILLANLIYYSRRKFRLTRYPLNLLLDDFDLTILGKKIYDEMHHKTFLAELIILQKLKFIDLTTNKNKLLIKVKNKDDSKLKFYQKIIFNKLKLNKNPFTDWKKSFKEDKNIKFYKLNTKKFKKSFIKQIYVSTILGIFSGMFLFGFTILKNTDTILKKIYKLKSKPYPNKYLHELNPNDKKFYEKYFFVINCTILIIITYITITLNSFNQIYSIIFILTYFFITYLFNVDLLGDSEEQKLMDIYNAIEGFSELENVANLNYFFNYEEYAAFALTLDMTNSKFDNQIKKLIDNIKIKN